ncbi:MAG: type II toxin-antitoxin system VapC family toxin [Gammaproteobacteria bacterium]|nr:type II toxin-antitoxin system VapC family toxin [Gammaproteobacteria bacterium]
MIFVDTNVFMYAVGREHPLKPLAREFFLAANLNREQLTTSSEVLQELAYCYLSVGRKETLVAAMLLIAKVQIQIGDLESADVYLACQLHDQYPALSARDLCHLASCQRRNVTRIKTFDHRLATVAGSKV